MDNPTIDQAKTLKKAFGYLRVSGDGQVQGDGFPRQRAAILKWAASNGYRIVRWFQEEGVSGCAEGIDRPAFTEMKEALLANGVKTVIIERLDRIARDVIIQESILKDLTKRGFELISAAEPDLCSNDPYRSAMRQMLGVFAELDRKTIVLKLRAARQRMKAKTGRCEGRKPYGHREGETQLFERMKEMHAAGATWESIAKTLNAEGIKTRHNGIWYPATIRRMVLKQAA
jgi:DNA invertase Pin-like site-specific DNA recombinase